MGILHEHKDLISELRKSEWMEDEWGSPHTRRNKNTKMYVKFFLYDLISYQILYFPPEFEGYAYFNGFTDVQGKVILQRTVAHSHELYISDLIYDEMSIWAFVRMHLPNESLYEF